MLGPKVKPVRSEPYRRLIASFPCLECGLSGNSQAAHANFGRGLGQKATDIHLFPLCAPRPGIIGCHQAHDLLVGMTLDERRDRERDYIQRAQEMAIQASWDNHKVRDLLIRIGLVTP